MKGKQVLDAVFALAAGIVLICMHDRINLVQWVIVFVGVMFAIPGLFGLIEALVGRRKTAVAVRCRYSLLWVRSLSG